RLKGWFNNNTRGSKSGSNNKVLDLSSKATRKLPPYQVYQMLYWKSRLQAIVDPEWEAHKASTPGVTSRHRMAFRNKKCRELLEEESEEVQEEIRRYVDEGFEEEDESDESGGRDKLRTLQK
ncbi:hypothetical protein BV25DRAFT_1807555, partial [Artomyces pyxidatus]